MKKDHVYRFSLQFAADSQSRIRAGEFLERSGNKKSAVIVQALNEYIQRHPELENNTLRLYIEEETSLHRDRLESLIRNIVHEQLSCIDFSAKAEECISVPDALDEDISQMLSNLDLFG